MDPTLNNSSSWELSDTLPYDDELNYLWQVLKLTRRLAVAVALAYMVHIFAHRQRDRRVR